MQLIGLMDGVRWSADWLGGVGEVLCRNAAAGFATSLWQGAAIATALWLGMKMAPRTTAAQRFAVWAAGFVATAGLAVFSLADHLNAGSAGSGFASGAMDSARPWLEMDARWGVAIACLWAAAGLYRAADLAVHSVRLRKLWKTAKPIAEDSGDVLRAGVAGGRRAEVCTTDALERPSVIGFFAPRILIPGWLYARLTRGELEQIVLHESEHLRRGDDWTNLLQKLCLIVFPVNPALWWMERKLCGEREMACDEGVVRITHAPRAYASCLASIAERGLERRMGSRAEALSLGAWERRSDLVERVQGILKRRRGLSPVAAGVMLGAMGCGLAVGSVELAKCPQLVAFVPEQKIDSARALEAAAKAGKLENVKSTLPSGYYALSAKATMAEPKSANARHVAARIEKKTAEPVQVAAADVRERMLGKNAAETARSDSRAQGWIVLTTWEQVQVTRNAPESDYDASRAEGGQAGAGEAAAAGTAEAVNGNREQTDGNTGANKGRGARQYRVTQLILKILPASSKSDEPGATAIGSGWFVIQL